MRRILIIPTAGLATRLQPVSFAYPKALIPIGDQPVLANILQLYAHIEIDHVILIVAERDAARFQAILTAFKHIYAITILIQKEPLGLLNAIYQAKFYIQAADQLIIHLADTLLNKSFRKKDFSQDSIWLSQVASSQSWCMANLDNQDFINKLEDKPAKSNSLFAVIGIYFFTKAQQFLSCLEKAKDCSELSAAIQCYIQYEKVKGQKRTDWHDIGNICHLHQLTEQFDTAKKAIVKRQGNIIIKKTNQSRLQAESYYYHHVSNVELFPHVLNASKTQLKLSYLPMRSLAYFALFEPMNKEVTSHIIHSLWQELHSSFYQRSIKSVDFSHQTEWMYGQRVIDAVNQSCEEWARINFWSINGKSIKGFPVLQERILSESHILAKSAICSTLHGDLHFGNILYDPLSNTFKLLDPRGMWGQQYALYGDIRYDFAKFLHSFHGGYEYIKRGLSKLKTLGRNSYSLTFPDDPWHTYKVLSELPTFKEIQWREVLWIEGLCFLSMTRCYDDESLKKQFFLRGIYLLNQIL